jgi:predicted nucleic acid-binding Zn finger protein
MDFIGLEGFCGFCGFIGSLDSMGSMDCKILWGLRMFKRTCGVIVNLNLDWICSV